MKFKVGDCVESIHDNPSGNPELLAGDTGTVVHEEGGIVYIRWDLKEPNPSIFHSCDGKCERGYGWNVWFDEVEVMEDIPHINIDDLMSLIGVVV